MIEFFDDGLGEFYQFYWIDGTRDDFPMNKETSQLLSRWGGENSEFFTFKDVTGRIIRGRTNRICSIAESTPESRHEWRIRNRRYDLASDKIQEAVGEWDL